MVTTDRPAGAPNPIFPHEWIVLQERIESLPEPVRSELAVILEDALEHAIYRGRVLDLAREALEQLHLELAATRFDLDVTRREREAFRLRLRSWDGADD